ncbi:MAG TPA: ATP-dependent helicase [Opitutaceae bacterium]|jgi:DNA helicase-2/ATP-dependent DNA helicase PcrA|nr:ATP-dependent helicase [Opitutaceae bacterium]
MDFPLESEPPAGAWAKAGPAIDFRGLLNDEQYAAVTAQPGPMLVLAGAGSGKTRTLTYRVAWLLSQGVRPGDILLLTFTNKAAKEMLHRVHDLTGFEPARFWGGTFHSMGHRALRSHGEALGLKRSFTILDAEEAEGLLRDAVEEADKGFFKDKAHPRPGPLHAMISLARNTRLPLGETIARHFPQHDGVIDRVPAFAQRYADKKRESGVLDYDDLLEFWLDLLKSSPDTAAYFQHRFRHVLVDEYQDTNRLQSEIVDLIGAHHRVMAVGDDAQCIYSWRGANFENILTFPDRHPGTEIFRIETNYRSTPQILALANGVLEAQPKGRHFDKELRPARANSEKPFYVQTMDGREQAQFIVQRVRGLVDQGCDLKDIAILYRAHFQALDIQLELSRLQIPYQITSGVRFFEQAHVRDLVALLRFVYNAGDTMAWQRIAVLLPKVGDKGAQKLHAAALDVARGQERDFLDALGDPAVAAKVPPAGREEWPKLVASLQQVGEAMRTMSPANAVDLAIDGWYGDYLKGAYANYGSRLDDLKSLVGFAGRFPDMQELLAQIMLLNSETSDRSVDPDADALRLTTVHQAKGLEFSAVFLISLADGLFPLRRSIESGDVEEERRLFYVAVTRARDELYLCFPKVNTKGGPAMLQSPSRFLQELSPDLYQELRLRRTYGW